MSSPIYPRVWKWTVKEFHRAIELKIWEGLRPFLIRSELFEQESMSPRHACGLTKVDDTLRKCFTKGCYLRTQSPVVLSEDTDPMPDFVVVPGTVRDYTETHPTTALLIGEVSDNALEFDSTIKAELYAYHDILEYWVVDLMNSRLLVYREPVRLSPNRATYRSQLSLGVGDSVSPLAKPDAAIAVAELLP